MELVMIFRDENQELFSVRQDLDYDPDLGEYAWQTDADVGSPGTELEFAL